MRHLPVHWSEGLFLRPHHFQAADRYWTETLQTSEHWDHPYNYGVQAIELGEEAIANYQFQINVCHARMKDGTLISIEPGQEPDRVDLREAFESESTVRVFLAVPKLKMGSTNVAPPDDPGQSRYAQIDQSVQDESLGGNDQELQFRSPNIRLMLSTQDLAGYEVLPIAQVQRAGEKEAIPRVDQAYFPPTMAIDAWPPLGRDVVRAIYDIIGQKSEVLNQQISSRGTTMDTQQPGDLSRLVMLSELNQAYATLGVLGFAAGVHPFQAYVELVRIIGQLSIFGVGYRPPEVPHYDHDDLARIFYWAKKQIELLLGAIKPPQYEQRFFVGEGKGMQVALDPKWFNLEWEWFVGVSRGGELSEADCLTLLSPGGLNWKLGSARQVDRLFEFGAEGLHLTPLKQAPQALALGRNWLYFQVSRGNVAWKEVLETESLAMRLKDSLIVNRDELRGTRDLIVAVAGKQVPLQFALFAVPKQP